MTNTELAWGCKYGVLTVMIVEIWPESAGAWNVTTWEPKLYLLRAAEKIDAW